MCLSVCYRRGTSQVAFVEAPEAFLRVLLELGRCNLDALTALLQSPIVGDSANPSSDSACTSTDNSKLTPLDNLAQSFGEKGSTPESTSQEMCMAHPMAGIRPSPDLELLLLSITGTELPFPGQLRASKAFKMCTSRCVLFPASLRFCPICYYLGPGSFRCKSEFAQFMPLYEGQVDLNPLMPIYGCEEAHTVSNAREVTCCKCLAAKTVMNVGILDRDRELVPQPWFTGPYVCCLCEEFSDVANAPCTKCKSSLARSVIPATKKARGAWHPLPMLPMTRRKTAAVVPLEERARIKGAWVLDDGLKAVKFRSLHQFLMALKGPGVLSGAIGLGSDAAGHTRICINLGCMEVLSLARSIRVPGKDHVFSEALASVLPCDGH